MELTPTEGHLRMATVREQVMDWDENRHPTMEQVDAALVWWKVSGGRPAKDGGKVERLLRRVQPSPPLPMR